MNKKIIKLALLVLSVLLVMSCIGCADTKEATEKEMIIGAPVATSLDPAIEWQGWTTVRYGVGETLFALDDKMNPKPWIAKSYKLVDDNTWKITLKKGVVFSNGNKLTPEIVIANLKRVGEVNNRASVFKTAEYKVEDDLNFTIKTAEPYATLINDLCDPYAVIVDLDATEDINLKPICTGPFVASETVKEQYYVVVRNDNYWDGKPMLSKVTFKAVGDENTLSMALQSGEIDAAHNITATTASELFGGKADYNVNIIPTSRVYMTYYNLKTMDQPLREAVTKTIDRKSICTDLLNNGATLATCAFPESIDYGGTKVRDQQYNLEEAKKILADAGYKDTDGDGYLEKDGKKVELKLYYYSRLSLDKIVTEMQAELKKIGIKVNIEIADSSKVYFKSGDYDMGMYCIVTNSNGDGESFLKGTFLTGQSNNFNGYSDPEVDALLGQLSKEFDPDKRAKLAIDIQKKALSSYSVDFIAFNNMTIVSKSTVSGLEQHPTDYYQLTANTDIK